MPETVSMIAQGVMGNERYTKFKVTMGTSSATADVPTGFKTAWAVVTGMNGATSAGSVRYNSMTANTATAGLSMASCTSAGSYVVVAFGPNGA